MDALAGPVALAAAEWLAVAALGAVCAYLARVGRGVADTQRATKVLMRSDLILRAREAISAGRMSEEARLQWCDDHELYLRLVGKNSYLDEMRREVMDLPAFAPERGGSACAGGTRAGSSSRK